MNLDERLEFLTKNIESLHEAVFENTRNIAEMRDAMAEQNRRFDARFERVVGMIERLVEAAESHERRLRRLEGNGQPE